MANLAKKLCPWSKAHKRIKIAKIKEIKPPPGKVNPVRNLFLILGMV